VEEPLVGMVDKILITLIVFGAFFNFGNAQYAACDYKTTISGAGLSVSINHLASYGTCRYQIIAPVNTFIQATCTLTLQGTVCSNQQFVISRSGEKDFKDGQVFCKSAPITSKSIGNEMVVAYNANNVYTGSVQCKFVAVAPANGNCDCGWNVQSKIVGGTPSGVNQFVSHAGLYDTQTREMFCGAIISELLQK